MEKKREIHGYQPNERLDTTNPPNDGKMDRKAILTTVTPSVNTDGTPGSVKKIDAILYRFTVEFDNGDVGQALSKRAVDPYEIGKEYVYYKTDRGDHVSIGGMRPTAWVKSEEKEPSGTRVILRTKKTFVDRLKSVRTLREITVLDEDSDLRVIPAGTTSHGKEATHVLLTDNHGEEVGVSLRYFGEGRNTQYFEYDVV